MRRYDEKVLPGDPSNLVNISGGHKESGGGQTPTYMEVPTILSSDVRKSRSF